MNIYQTALDVQNASNFSGVVLAFAECMKIINNEEETKKLGDQARRNHPVTRLFLSKLCGMAGYTDCVTMMDYFTASRICEAKVADASGR